MKTLSISILFIVLNIAAFAQYKKASFFKRGGRTYELSAGVQVYGSGAGASPTFAFSYGKDKGNNRIFHWWDLELVMPSKFKYNTLGYSNGTPILIDVPAVVTGKSDLDANWRYNLAYYLSDNTNEDNNFLPFIKLAVATFIRAGDALTNYTVSPRLSPNITPADKINFSADFGAGAIYKLNANICIKGSLGYRVLAANNKDPLFFPTIKNHPYLNVGIRYTMPSNE